MKKTKLFFGNQYVESFNCDGKRYTKWQLFKIKTKIFFKKLLFWLIVILIAIGIGQYIRYAYPTTITKEVVKEVIVNQDISYPVLDRIMFCESGGKHIGKNGQVIVNGNKNGSVDIGIMMINDRIWGKTATDMGLNLWVEKDNREFGKYLFAKYGSEPWIWSKSCWNK